MNKTSYFGNRFASALRGFRSNRKSSKQLAVASTPAASEFEALESRILLSGIGTGLNKKQVTFIDADGDKVTVKALGKGAKFNIDLGGSTNNADIANIEIGRDGTSIGISVAPVGSFTKPTQTKAFINPNWDLGDLGGGLGAGGELSLDKLTATNQKIQTQYYNLTPGYTNIGSITAADGITEVGSIGLTAAVVPVIDLPGVAVGNINLSTGQIAKVDAFMSTNGSYLQGYGGWVPGMHNINIYDINAGSLAGINIAGVDPDLYKAALKGWADSGMPDAATDLFTGNNYLGVITTDAGGIGRLTGTNSMFMGQLSLGGTDAFLGNTVLKGWAPGSIISAEGDLTFNAKGFQGVIEVGGHLNLGLQAQAGKDNTGSFFAGEGISGIRSGTTDAIIISVAFKGDLVAKGGDIADITIAGGGNINGALIESANKIGTIWSSSSIDTATILAGTDLEGITLRNASLGDPAATPAATAPSIFVGGTLGLIDIAGGNISENATLSATTFGEVLLRSGNLDGTLLAKDGIGEVTIVGGSLAGALIAQGDAGIGAIDVTALDGGDAIADGAVINSAKDITSITATTTGGTAIGSANIQAAGTLGPIEAIAYGGTGGGAIDGLVLIAPTIGNITASSAVGIAINNSQFITTTGNVGSITATGFAGGISGGQVTSAGNVGAITGTAIAQGSGITGLTVTAQTGINNVVGKALGTGGAEYGIGESTFTAVSGNIGNITGSTSNPAGAGSGVYDSQITAVAGTVGNVTGTAAGSGTGLNDVGVQADKGIGTITGSSFQGNGIDDGLYKAINGDIEAVTATTSEGVAIAGGAEFVSIGGTIKAVTATPTGVGGEAVNGATFRGANIGNLSFAVTNLAGGLAVNALTVEATNGNVGTITVTNASLDGAATGLTNSKISATGNIGQVTVSAVGDGANAIGNLSLTADSEGDETGDVAGVTATSKSGSAIVGGAFEGANVGAIKATVTSLAGNLGIDGLNVTATKGNIGSIEATTAGNDAGDHAIKGGTYKATGNVGPINVSANAGNGLENLTVTADEDGDDAGDIVSITATSKTGIAINNGPAPTYQGANIGAIVATVTGDGGPAIQGETFIATAGNIASVTATTAGEGGGDHAIVGTTFEATGNVGPINATALNGDALNNVTVEADTDGKDGGEITSITASTTEGNAIFGGTYDAAKIGAIVAKVTGDGLTGISNAKFTALDGDIASITVTNASESGGRGITFSEFTGANIGNVEVTISKEDGGTGIENSDFTANGTNAADTISNGKVGTMKVTSASEAGLGLDGVDVFAGIGVDGDAIGNITVALTKSTALAINAVNLDASFDAVPAPGTAAADQKAKIGTVTTTGDNLGILGLTAIAPVSIGAITSSGTGNQSVDLDAPTSGALTFNGLGNANTVTVDATAKVTTLGAITVEAPGGTPANTGNLTITGATAVTTLGAIAVDGELTLPSLTTLKTASTIGAFTIDSGGSKVGTGLAGSSIGLVTIGDGSAGVNNVTFQFATMNGKTNATADATLAVDFLLGAGPDITTLQAKSPGTTVAGVTAILV